MSTPLTTIPSTLLFNGRISIGDESPDAEAIVVSQGRVVAVGSTDDVAPHADSQTRRIDLGGRRLIPGLIDSHIHLVRAGGTWYSEARWDDISSLEEGLDLIRRAVARRGPGQWVRVLGGWHPRRLAEGRGPTLAELDAVSGDSPVYVQHLYDNVVVNSKALELAGFAARPTDGVIVERDSGGRPTGVVRGKPAFDALTALVGQPDPAQRVASTRSFLADLAAYGVTGVADANGFGVTPASYDALFELWRSGELTVRTRLYLGPSGAGTEVSDFENWARFTHPAFGDGMLRLLGFGESLSFGVSDLEGLAAEYQPSYAGRDEVRQVTLLALERGWPVHAHAILPQTISAILDVWEGINRDIPLTGRRFSLCHAEAITGKDIQRLRSLDIAVSVQNRLMYRSADSAKVWGTAVAHNAPPIGDLVAAGVPLAAGTDSTVVASPNPWLCLWWLITGKSVDGAVPRSEAHRVSRADALRMYTVGSAYLSFEDDERGTLAPGMRADLAVLSDDFFAVQEDEIPRITALLTIVDGRIVHSSGELGIGVDPALPPRS
jgi:predicted amidohydrolase YtcJ